MPKKGRGEVDHSVHAERFHVRVCGSKRSQEVRAGVTGQHDVDGQVCEDMNRGPNLMKTGILSVGTGDGVKGVVPIRQ